MTSYVRVPINVFLFLITFAKNVLFLPNIYALSASAPVCIESPTEVTSVFREATAVTPYWLEAVGFCFDTFVLFVRFEWVWQCVKC